MKGWVGLGSWLWSEQWVNEGEATSRSYISALQFFHLYTPLYSATRIQPELDMQRRILRPLKKLLQVKTDFDTV